MRRITLLFLAVSLLPPARSAAPAAPAAPAPVTTDHRLSSPVTCNAIGTDLGRLTKLIGGETGVRIRVAKDISDEKLDVFVKDIPLASLMKHITGVFGYRWASQPSRTGPTTYLLWRDANTRDRQARLAGLKARREDDHLRADMQHVRDILAMKDEDVEKMSEEDKFFAKFVRGDYNRTGYTYLSNLSGSDRQALFTDGFRKSLSDLPPEIREAFLKRVGTPCEGCQWTKETLTGIAVELGTHGGVTPWGRRPGYLTISMMFKDEPVEGFMYPLSIERAKNQADRPDPVVLAENMRGFASPGAKLSLDDPRFGKPVKPAKVRTLKYGSSIWTDDSEGFDAGLQRIADSTGVPIVSDYYTTHEATVSLTGLNASDAVSRLCERCGHQAVMKDGALLLRNNDWPDLMPLEVPLRVLDALAELAGPASKGYIPVLNLSQSLIAAHLTDAQVGNLGAYGYNAFWNQVGEMKAFIQFLATLTPLQMEQVRSDAGLDASALSGAAADAFRAFYDARWTRIGVSPRVQSIRISLVDDPGDGNKPLSDVDLIVTMPIELPNERKESMLGILLGREKGDDKPRRPAVAVSPAS